MKFIQIEASNTHLIENFINQAGTSLETFRYFEKYPFSVVQNHAGTWVIEDDGLIKAYGHLDREGNTIWLGIAVANDARGKGLGHAMMTHLMDSAKALAIPAIMLSVDNVNEPAIRLYERFGFHLLAKGETSSFYEWKNEAT